MPLLVLFYRLMVRPLSGLCRDFRQSAQSPWGSHHQSIKKHKERHSAPSNLFDFPSRKRTSVFASDAASTLWVAMIVAVFCSA